MRKAARELLSLAALPALLAREPAGAAGRGSAGAGGDGEGEGAAAKAGGRGIGGSYHRRGTGRLRTVVALNFNGVVRGGKARAQGQSVPGLREAGTFLSADVSSRCLLEPHGSFFLRRSLMAEIYVSTDVETDGPIPGPHSMLSFASAAYRGDKTLLATFSANLHTLLGAAATPTRWAAADAAGGPGRARRDLQDPAAAMKAYVAWVKHLPGKPVFVAYPAGFDFLFVYWYMIRFAGESPFSHSALDVKTFAMAILHKDYRDSTKENMPRAWFDPLPHTHKALDDAIEQVRPVLQHACGEPPSLRLIRDADAARVFA